MHEAAAYAALAAVVLLVHAHTLAGGFVSDDVTLILKSGHVHSLKNVPGMFAQGFSQTRGAGHAAPYYRPVVSASFALDYAIGGPGRPWVFHLTNLIACALCAVLVYALFKLLLHDRASAFVGGMLFAALAVHSETVAWISGRTDLFALVFVLAAALCLLAARRARAPVPAWAAAAALFLLALLSKEVALALLPLWLAFELTCGRRGRLAAPLGRRLGGLVALAAACGAYLLMRHAALGPIRIEAGPRHFDPLTMPGMATIAACVWQYLARLALPVGLSFTWEVEPFARVGAAAVLCLAGAVGLLGLTVWASVRRPVVGFALWWMWLGLAPALNLVPIAETVAVRFMFVPSAGFCLLVAAAFGDVLSEAREPGRPLRVPLRAATTAVVLLIAAQAVLSVALDAQWRSQRRLYLASLEADPDSAVAQALATEVYLDDPFTPERAGRHAQRCLELSAPGSPLRVMALSWLANAFIREQRLAPALIYLEEAVRLNPGLGQTRGTLALVLVELAREDGLPRAWDQAAEHAARLLQAGQARGDAYVVLACRALDRDGGARRAGELFDNAIKADPACLPAAVAGFQEAVRRHPGDSEAFYQLARFLARSGNVREALRVALNGNRMNATPDLEKLIRQLEAALPEGERPGAPD